MKYKKHIATGVLAFSLLISGTNVFAATPQDVGIKNGIQTSQKQGKNLKTKNVSNGKAVGTISSISTSGFLLDLKNIKNKTASSMDVIINPETIYSKNGLTAAISDMAVGQKVIVIGTLDETTNIMTAKTVKIAS